MKEDKTSSSTYTIPCSDTVHCVEFSPFEWSCQLLAAGTSSGISVFLCRFQEEDASISKGIEYTRLRDFSTNCNTLAIAWSPQTSLQVLPKILRDIVHKSLDPYHTLKGLSSVHELCSTGDDPRVDLCEGGEKHEKKKDKGIADANSPSLIATTSVVYIFPNGDRYEGECILTDDDSIERSGTGTHITAAGIIYQGTWDKDRMNGNGKLQHPSGASYEGDFLNNHFHGQGKYTWPDGSFYEGQFVENRLEGEGTFTDIEGQVWVGSFHYKAALGLKFKLSMD